MSYLHSCRETWEAAMGVAQPCKAAASSSGSNSSECHDCVCTCRDTLPKERSRGLLSYLFCQPWMKNDGDVDDGSAILLNSGMIKISCLCKKKKEKNS